MKPEKVNPSNFKLREVLYDNGEFSIAYGIYDGGKEPVIAMRWNGKNEKKFRISLYGRS